jgi:hypothetical protein
MMRNQLRNLLTSLILAICSLSIANAQPLPNPKHSDSHGDRFYQIDQWLPTPNDQRTASGAPGPEYWQQRADYQISVTLDDSNQRISGVAKIDYHNESPHLLNYIWVQLDQNRFEPDAISATASPAPSLAPRVTFDRLRSIFARLTFDGGYKIKSVKDQQGSPLTHTINETMMRIDLPKPMMPGESLSFSIDYAYNIIDSNLISGRSGHEYFEKDGNYIYEIAQWFPRVVSYTDYTGWQNKQFIGRGEFTLELGNYDVSITVPEDMVVASTGELANPDQVLKPVWIERLAEARKSNKPMFIVTPEEAKQNEGNGTSEAKATETGSSREGNTNNKTWRFIARNVRDFAFAASRKFIWDAMGVKVGDQTVMAMSYYPNEGDPLWSQYSTEAIAHTLEVYGRYSFDYPYPVAISVNGPVYGMEYPMICFNGPRPEEDGTYSKATKYALISVIIHEVGHNYFPMIVNSDERQWTWMDEGLNTFLQYLSEQEWEEDYPSRRGEPEKIVPYMRGGNQRPIMTGSEEILQFGANAYAKPATALNILRETIMGRELFDFAFKEYAVRWKFKRPTPSDFFRTMEDASGVDLDWFWRGWFYSTDHVDLGIEDVNLFVIDQGDPDEAAEQKRKEREEKEPSISDQRNQELPKRIDWQPGLKDFYNSADYDEFSVEESARKAYQKMLEELDDTQRSLLQRTTNFYVVKFRNHGGIVMPIIVRLHYADNTNEIVRVPVDIWRSNGDSVSKLFVSEKEIVRMELDPFRETADTESSNNHWPPKLIPSRFKLYKSGSSDNEMRKANKKKEAADKKAAKEAENASQGDEESDDAVGDASGDNQSGQEADDTASSNQSSQ